MEAHDSGMTVEVRKQYSMASEKELGLRYLTTLRTGRRNETMRERGKER
jgi:hypothetical protein